MASTNYDSSGIIKRAFGSFSGTYTAADQVLNVGFKVVHFRIVNVTDGLSHEWYDPMNAGDYLETTRAGATQQTLETDDSIRVNYDSAGNQVDGKVFIDVSVGNIITDNDTVVWEAHG